MKRIISGLLLTTMIANTTVQARVIEDSDDVKVLKQDLPAGFDNALLSRQLNDNKSYTELRDVEFLTSRPAPVDPSTRDALVLGTLASSPEEDSFFSADNISENAKKPLVLINKKDGSKRINENYIGFQRTIHIMNDLSYAIAKRQGYGDDLNKWISELNKTQKDYVAFKASREKDVEVNDDDFLDLREELTDRDYQRHIEFCKWKIKELEQKVIENINRSNGHFKDLKENGGWEWKVIEGKTGYKSITGSDRAYVPDDRGFVAYQKSTNTIIVVYHGSRNEKDWDTNFDGQAVTALDVGLKLPDNPLLHRGFGHAVASCEQQVKDAIRDFVREHEEENKGNRKDLNIYVTGHSQGAAVASISFMDLAINLGKELFGEGYKNAEKNNFKGIFFSAPRSFARRFGEVYNKSLALLNEEVGADNMMRQNVYGDPVPHASKKAIGIWEGRLLNLIDYFFDLRKLSFFQKPQFENIRVGGISLVDALKNANFVSYDSVGHLALDSVVAAQKRVWWDAAKAFWKRTTTNFVDVAKNSIQRALGYETPGKGIMDFIGNTAKDMAMTLVAPFHNGVLQEDAGAAFDPSVVGNNPNSMLAAGLKNTAVPSPSEAPHQAEAGTVSQPNVVGQKPDTLPTVGLANEKVEIESQSQVFDRAKDAVTATASSAWKAVKGWFGRK